MVNIPGAELDHSGNIGCRLLAQIQVVGIYSCLLVNLYRHFFLFFFLAFSILQVGSTSCQAQDVNMSETRRPESTSYECVITRVDRFQVCRASNKPREDDLRFVNRQLGPAGLAGQSIFKNWSWYPNYNCPWNKARKNSKLYTKTYFV